MSTKYPEKRVHRNQYGLSRNIPVALKRQISLAQGYGCAVCGGILGEYHHFDPEYRDCDVHHFEGILFLCHKCHAEASNGTLPVESIRKAKLNPFSRRKGVRQMNCPALQFVPEFSIGSNRFINCRSAIQVQDRAILKLSRNLFGDYLVNGVFHGRTSGEYLEILDNELIIRGQSVKIDRNKNVYTVSFGESDCITFSISERGLAILSFKCKVGQVLISVSNNVLKVSTSFGTYSYSDNKIVGFDFGLLVVDGRVTPGVHRGKSAGIQADPFSVAAGARSIISTKMGKCEISGNCLEGPHGYPRIYQIENRNWRNASLVARGYLIYKYFRR